MVTTATHPPQERDSWVRDTALEGMLHMLSERTLGLPDANDPDSSLIRNGVGSNSAEAYVNKTFALRDYCWCEGGRHPEIVDWDEDESGYLEIPPSGGTSSGCPLNFEHFASGLKAEWYKGLGRDVLFNRAPRPDEALAVLMDCLGSMPGMDHLPPIKNAFRQVCGW